MRADFRICIGGLLSIASLTRAFYIPGYSAKKYRDGESIPLFVNKIYSDNTELQYAYAELPFVCQSSGRNHGSLMSGTSVTLSLGEVLRGDRITVSDYELKMGENDDIHLLCTKKLDQQELEKARQIVKDGYVAEWIVDNLPGATSFVSTDRSRRYYAGGFRLGHTVFSGDYPRYYINNHVTLVIRYNSVSGSDKKVIVGFEVFPKSIDASKHDPDTMLPVDTNATSAGLELIPNEGQSAGKADNAFALEIRYTYSVYFREDNKLDWQNRWDMYFVGEEGSSKIHWLAIINSCVILGVLSAVVAVVVARTIRGDISAGIPGARGKSVGAGREEKTGSGLLDQLGDAEAGDLDDDDGTEELTGWKLVHGDVFRSPPYGEILAPIIGSGMQLGYMATGLIVLSCLGVLNPSWRGGFVSVAAGLFVIAGLISGYFSARVYKTFGGKDWQKNAFLTGILVPGLFSSILFILNLFVWGQASSTAIPFGTLIALLFMWLLVQLPLVFVSSWYGFVRAGSWEHPIKSNTIARQIPRQPWYTKGPQAALLSGLVPFAVIFIELLFLLGSVWQDKSGYYYMFGFLAVVGFILIITVVEVSIVATYFLLSAENYHWWWHSFFVGASSAVWIFLYCFWFYLTKLHISGFVSSLLFFAYSFLACCVYGLLMGTIGFLASYAFVRRIYG